MGQIVLDHEDLARRLKGLKTGGKRVVVTNGCFDLLHVGHVRCLVDAARRGDCLVVALNSDASVRRLKGAGRPLQPEAERAELVAAIQGVTYVTIFAEESVGPLLRRLRPNFLAKGTDYTPENLPERDVLTEIGAELMIVGDPKRHSTRNLLDKVRATAVAAARAAEKAHEKTTPAPKARPAKPGRTGTGTRATPAKRGSFRPAKARSGSHTPSTPRRGTRGAESEAHA